MAKVHLVNNARINAKRAKISTPNRFKNLCLLKKSTKIRSRTAEGLSIPLVLPRIHETSLEAKYGNQQEKANTNG